MFVVLYTYALIHRYTRTHARTLARTHTHTHTHTHTLSLSLSLSLSLFHWHTRTHTYIYIYICTLQYKRTQTYIYIYIYIYIYNVHFSIVAYTRWLTIEEIYLFKYSILLAVNGITYGCIVVRTTWLPVSRKYIDAVLQMQTGKQRDISDRTLLRSKINFERNTNSAKLIILVGL